jgi:hypothetical protein
MDSGIDFVAYALPLTELARPRVQELVRRARLIWGWDWQHQQAATFFGRKFLEDLAMGREAEFDCRLAFVTPDNIDNPYLDAMQAPLAIVFGLNGGEHEELARQIESLKGESDFSSRDADEDDDEVGSETE